MLYKFTQRGVAQAFPEQKHCKGCRELPTIKLLCCA